MEEADFTRLCCYEHQMRLFHSGFIAVCRDDPEISHFNSETMFSLQKATKTCLCYKCLKHKG